MFRRASLCWKVMAVALLSVILSSAASSYSLHAQGAIGQPDPTGAVTGTAKDVTLGAAVYRVGAPPKDAGAARVKVDHGGRLVFAPPAGEGDAPAKLARGVVVIYVEKVTR